MEAKDAQQDNARLVDKLLLKISNLEEEHEINIATLENKITQLEIFKITTMEEEHKTNIATLENKINQLEMNLKIKKTT